jgi:hypothetical protein
MNELFLYQLLENILKFSSVIEGRFFVAEGYGNDLNANNLNDIVKDALSNYKPTDRKYPLSLLLPPMEIVSSNEKMNGWTRFKLEQYFLTTTGYSGVGEFKSINRATNISEHPIRYDWKDMREVAGNFRRQFLEVLRTKRILNSIRPVSDSSDIYRRFSSMNNDNLSGVSVSWEVEIYMPCTMADYEAQTPDQTVVPDSIIHPIHKH